MHLQMDYSGGDLSVVQITDTHLGVTEDATLAGVTTAHSLRAILAAVGNEPEPDLMLFTGDLADDGSSPAYARLRQMTEGFGCVKAWLPGNHDNLQQMRAVAPEFMVGTIGAGPWGIIMLNSQVLGEIGGALAEPELERLVCFLRDESYRYFLVCVHHQPLPVNSRWLDEQRIANGRQFLHLLDQCRVKGVLWGHVHQQFDAWHGKVRLLATPSTCVQFAPASEDFKVDRSGPGYRRLLLKENGELSTEVRRLDAAGFSVNYECVGY